MGIKNAIVVFGVFVCMSQAQAAAAFVDLGALPRDRDSYAEAINDAGVVVGRSYAYSPVDSLPSGTIWNGATVTDLGADSVASGINNVGQVVGVIGLSDSVMWSGVTPVNLGNLPGAYGGRALAINSAGQVVGLASVSGGYYNHATLWGGNTATDLGTLGGTTSVANAINNVGQIVGSASTFANNIHAVVWNGLSSTDLGTLGGANSYARSINNLGQIVGQANDSQGRLSAVLWDGQNIVKLQTLAGGLSSNALAINSSGEIAGTSEVAASGGYNHAVIWYHGNILDLNNVVDSSVFGSGWIMTSATAINDNGVIAGDATNIYTGATHAFELSGVAMPVPEPSSLLLAVLGLVSVLSLSKFR